MESSVAYNLVCSYVYFGYDIGDQMTPEQLAQRLLDIKASHKRVQEKRAKELLESDEEVEIVDLFDEFEKTFKGDKKWKPVQKP